MVNYVFCKRQQSLTAICSALQVSETGTLKSRVNGGLQWIKSKSVGERLTSYISISTAAVLLTQETSSRPLLGWSVHQQYSSTAVRRRIYNPTVFTFSASSWHPTHRYMPPLSQRSSAVHENDSMHIYGHAESALAHRPGAPTQRDISSCCRAFPSAPTHRFQNSITLGCASSSGPPAEGLPKRAAWPSPACLACSAAPKSTPAWVLNR